MNGITTVRRPGAAQPLPTLPREVADLIPLDPRATPLDVEPVAQPEEETQRQEAEPPRRPIRGRADLIPPLAALLAALLALGIVAWAEHAEIAGLRRQQQGLQQQVGSLERSASTVQSLAQAQRALEARVTAVERSPAMPGPAASTTSTVVSIDGVTLMISAVPPPTSSPTPAVRRGGPIDGS